MENSELNALKCFIFDENEDGKIDIIVEYTKDELGRIITVTLDYDNDGIPDSKIYLEYDAEGNICKKGIDKNLNGKIDSIVIFERDNQGNISVHYDDNADGKIDFIETTDENGNITIKDTRGTIQKVKETIKNVFFTHYKY